MTDHDAWIAGIRAHPHEDVRRLAYADWLEERDEAEKSSYLCIVHSLAMLPERAAERSGLVDRLIMLGGNVDREWREAVGRRFDVMLEGRWVNAAFGAVQWFGGMLGMGSTTGASEEKLRSRGIRIYAGLLREDAEEILTSVFPNRFDSEIAAVNLRIVPAAINPSGLTAPASE